MKRLSNARKAYLERRRPKLFARKVRTRLKRRLRRIASAAVVPPLQFKRVRGVPFVELTLPAVTSFSRNYAETMQFFSTFRRFTFRRGRKMSVNFTQLREIGPSAALMLAAEFDRWRTLFRFRPRVRDDIDRWDPTIRQLLFDMGLFDLLNVTNHPAERIRFATQTAIRYVKFRSGFLVVGKRAVELREALEGISGTVPDHRLLFKGLTEAMTNVVKHAYPDYGQNRDKYVGRPLDAKRWWMTASYEVTRRSLRVLFFDQGVGIPATITRKYPVERLRGFLNSIGLADDDGHRIKAAMELGRTSSQKQHRGKGLPNLQEIVDSRLTAGKRASLRVLSGKGEYLYEGPGQERCHTHPENIGGTLIQWDFAL